MIAAKGIDARKGIIGASGIVGSRGISEGIPPFCSAPTLTSLSATRATASISGLAVTGTRTTATAADQSSTSVGDVATVFTSDSSIVQQNWIFTSKVSTAVDLDYQFGVIIGFLDTITSQVVCAVTLALRTQTAANTNNAILDTLNSDAILYDDIAVSAGYEIAVAINTATGTCQFKDSSGRTGALTAYGSFNNTHPIVGVVVYNTGTTLNDSIVGSFNQGSQAFTVQITNAVSHCNSVAYSGFLPSQLSGIVAWYDPYDLSTMFTDIAGTTNVTASGDPVGKMLDKSGNGHHISASVDARRPIFTVSGAYKFLDFDGTDDCLFTSAAIDMTSTNDVSICAAVTRDVATALAIIEFSVNGLTTNGGWYLASSSAGRYESYGKGTITGDANSVAYSGALAIPNDSTVIAINPIDALSRIIVDGVETTAIDFDKGTGNYSTQVLYVGARANASSRWNGKNYNIFFTNTGMRKTSFYKEMLNTKIKILKAENKKHQTQITENLIKIAAIRREIKAKN